MGGVKSWFGKKDPHSSFIAGSSQSYRGDPDSSSGTPGEYEHLPSETASTTAATSSMEAPSQETAGDSRRALPAQPSVYTTSGTSPSATSSGPPVASQDISNMEFRSYTGGIPREQQLYPALSPSGRATFAQGGSPGGIQNYNEQSGKIEFENSPYVVAQAGLEVGPGQDKKLEAHEEVLVNIPGAMVHLIDQDGSALLTMGDLQLVRITQGETGVVAIVKVGDDIQWPLGWDEPVFKINSHRYVFTLRVSEDLDDDRASSQRTNSLADQKFDDEIKVSGCNSTNAAAMPAGVSSAKGEGRDEGGEVMSYGVTFVQGVPEATIQQFDVCLKQYCVFSEPEVVASQGIGAPAASSSAAPPQSVMQDRKSDVPGEHLAILSASKENVDSATKLTKMSAAASFVGDRSSEGHGSGAIVSRELVEEESGMIVPVNPEIRQLAEKNANYWTQVAPNVDDYRGSVARGIATGSGGVIKGIFYVSDATSSRLEKIGTFAKRKLKPGDPEKPKKISPTMMKSMKRARKLSKMTAKVADSVLAGVVTTTGVVTGAIIKRTILNTAVGKLLPGDVAIVSLDAFGKLFDAVELAGKNVLNTTSVVTSGVVTHRYGEQAGEFAKEGLAATGHMIHTAWTVSKLRKALTPSTTGAMKQYTKGQVAKGAIKGFVKGARS